MGINITHPKVNVINPDNVQPNHVTNKNSGWWGRKGQKYADLSFIAGSE